MIIVPAPDSWVLWLQDMHNTLKDGIEFEESQNSESSLLSAGERMALVTA